MVFAPLLTMAAWLKARQAHHYDSDALTDTVTITGAGQASLSMPILSIPNLGDVERVEATNGDRYFPPSFQASIDSPLKEPSDPERLYGVVTIAIQPNRLGQVKFKGGWWSAKCEQAIVLTQGRLVTILGRDNITLVVEPFGPDPHDEETQPDT